MSGKEKEFMEEKETGKELLDEELLEEIAAGCDEEGCAHVVLDDNQAIAYKEIKEPSKPNLL